MVIELLFLTAPLLAVPMAMTLAARLDRDLEASLFFRAAAALRIPAAILTAASFLPAAGVVAGTLAAPWALVTILVALSSVARFARGRPLPLDGLVALAGHLYLPVGGIFLVQSRAGIRPMGFLEPIVILTAVHFHFSGFVAPILASATGRALRSRGERARSLFAIVAVGVIGAPAVLAAGWMTSSPILKLTGAVSLALCHGGLALLTLSTLRDLRPKGAGWLVAISSLSLMTAMLLAAAYAIAEYRERPVLTIPFMAAAHGMLLVFGFSLCGLAGRQMEERHF